MNSHQPHHKVYSVSELTQKIKYILEETFPMIWIYGEISNIRIPSSGHAYFTLKDDEAQIATVMFRGQLRNLKFKLEDGLTISGLGRISLYEPRGTYQIILEYAEPKGIGALQIAFEQLKRKLAQEGLFDEAHKHPLPFLPACIGVITSPTGSVIKDILSVLYRRFPGIQVEIYPVRVQGDSAAAEIVHAIDLANRRATSDLVIVARGGGSLEDLAPFNSEAVARAVFASTIPVISAIGHETDYTIADFVSDMRVPTPSAAAELAVPQKSALQARCHELRQRNLSSISKLIANYRTELTHIRRVLVDPTKRIQTLILRTDDLSDRMHRAAQYFLKQHRSLLVDRKNRIFYYNPIHYTKLYKQKVYILKNKILESINKIFYMQRRRVAVFHAAMVALSPQSVLERGYSITRTIPDQVVVTQAEKAYKGQRLEILLAKGNLEVTVD